MLFVNVKFVGAIFEDSPLRGRGGRQNLVPMLISTVNEHERVPHRPPNISAAILPMRARSAVCSMLRTMTFIIIMDCAVCLSF